MLGPAIKALEDKINGLNLEIDALEQEEKERLINATGKCLDVKNKMISLKAALTALASETLKRTGMLLRILRTIKLDPNSKIIDKNKIEKKIGALTKGMASILERSETVLDEARKEYGAIQLELKDIEVDLKIFQTKVNKIMKNENGEFDRWVAEKRASSS